MPEGAEVLVLSKVIERAINKSFHKIEIIENIPGKLHRFSRTPIKHLEKLQSGFTIEKVGTKGKLIWIRFALPNQEKIWALNTLGMSGSWVWNRKEDKHTRLSFVNETENLSFNDIRNFGTFKLVDIKEAHKKLKSIGWDLLKSPAPEDKWRSFQYSKLSNKPVGEALMDQSIFSGIGNIYCCESMYEVGINPNTLVSDIPEESWNKINITSHNILKNAYLLGGSSIEMFSADGILGTAQDFHKIYGKTQCPLGHKVSRIKMGDRTKWFCPVCQV